MRQKKPREARSFQRKVHFQDGQTWAYRVGGLEVFIRDPAGKTYRIPLPEITRLSYDDMEKGHYKQWWSGVTPQEIKNYVDLHLRGQTEMQPPPLVFLHPLPEAARTWHLYKDCSFLPQISRGQITDAAEMSLYRAQEALGNTLTRSNLCGCCMHRSHKNGDSYV